MTIKKKREEAVDIVLTELKGMVPILLICNGVAIVSCVIYGLVVAHDFRLYTGLVIGNAATIGNFYHLGVKAGNVARMKDASRARRYATSSFFVRYFGAFAVFGVLIHFGLINAITAVIPLFYPKIHYTIKAMLNKSV
jgi:hypothetical protein